MLLILLILLVLVCGWGGGTLGHIRYGERYGYWAGPGFGIGTILVVFLLLYLFGLLPGVGQFRFPR
jgi:hypothetical protein